jgi:hypothetical protein
MTDGKPRPKPVHTRLGAHATGNEGSNPWHYPADFVAALFLVQLVCVLHITQPTAVVYNGIVPFL